jgi:hypothetical protein
MRQLPQPRTLAGHRLLLRVMLIRFLIGISVLGTLAVQSFRSEMPVIGYVLIAATLLYGGVAYRAWQKVRQSYEARLRERATAP